MVDGYVNNQNSKTPYKKATMIFFSLSFQAGLTSHTNPEKTHISYMESAALIFGCLFGIIILYFILRSLGYHIISYLIWAR